jgi:hypothetical protein
VTITAAARHDAGPFRALPRQMQAIQNNLSLANTDYFTSRSPDTDEPHHDRTASGSVRP